jgi:small conductance mechanosensitive channel
MNQLFSALNMENLASEVVLFLPSLIAALAMLGLFWLIFRLSRRPLSAMLDRAGLAKPLVALLVENVYRMSLLVFALVMAADQVGINVGAALAGIGVVGLAVGFAAQDSLANIIAGFLIFIDKPFEVGDWVSVVDEYGMVSQITMRSTRIRSNQNTYIVIPNKTILDAVLVNHSKHGSTRVDVPIGIAYKEDIPTARKVVLAAVQSLDGVAPHPRADVVITKLGSSSVDMDVRVWIEDAAHEQPVYFRVMEASKLALDQAGIEIPYHHLQLFIENVQESVLSQAARYLNPQMRLESQQGNAEGLG